MTSIKSGKIATLADREGRLAHLKRVEIFRDLQDHPGSIEALADVMKVEEFRAGDSMIREGEMKSEMFVLVEGQASVYKSTPEGDQYKVAIVKGEQNACFGEGGLLGSEARSATIKADSVCHCMVLDGASFALFCQANPHWALPIVLRITHAVMGRLRKANNDLMLLYNALVAEIRGH